MVLIPLNFEMYVIKGFKELGKITRYNLLGDTSIKYLSKTSVGDCMTLLECLY